jgi:hypothetical protein
MTLYVAFLAITNICLGFAVGLRLHSPRNRYTRERARIAVKPADACSESDQSCKQAAQGAVDAHPYEEAPNNQPDAGGAQASRRNVHSWLGEKCDFATRLREVTERANYSRSSRDKTLLRQAAEQVISCIRQRYDELQQILGSPAAGAAPLVGDALDAVEMFSAQIETSMSNLRALDWSETFDGVCIRLDSELSLLNEQQRMIASALQRHPAVAIR